MSATKEDIAFGQELRDRIINFLMEWITGPDIDSRTLAHFRFVAHHFSMPGIARELCDAQSVIARQELAVSLIVTALEIAIDDSPTTRQLQRRADAKERRDAAKEWNEKVVAAKQSGREDGKPGK